MVDETGQTSSGRFEPPTDEQMTGARAFLANYATAWGKDQVSAEDLREQIHADTRMLIPPMTEPADRDGVTTHFAAVLQRTPDLHLEVVRSAPTGDAVFVEWQARAIVAGQPVSWNGIDRFGLQDGLQMEGQAFWDTRALDAKIASVVEVAQAGAAT